MTSGAAARGGIPPGLSVVVALLPKCGLCAAAHASVLGAIGIGGAGRSAWTRGVAATAVLLAVGMMGWGAESRRGWAPFALGCAGAVLVLAGMIHAHPATHAAGPPAHSTTWMGIVAMLAASLWNAWPRRAAAVCPAPHC
jgi:hypothetical protein